MRTSRALVFGVVAVLGAVPAIVCAHPEDRPEAVETVPPSPGPAFTWVPGHWHYDGTRFLWVRGAWERPPYADAYWVQPGWALRGGERVFVPGRWRREQEDPHWVVPHQVYQYGWGWRRWEP